MSTTVDSRVVEMRFDNKNFESNVSTTMSTLDKLKSMLKLDGATKGLSEVGAAAKKCDLSPIGAACETVSVKFSAFQTMAVTALANITNSAVNAGKQMLHSLTIEPITTGFNEYELKMGSVQTIMASTGESLETVNKYLEELNEYSDKTIYSFSDMTQNIGKFTNAGVKLEDAVMAIKGISNEAAVSGANAQEASRAMYNFAQALSAGYVKLIDWKSIENANMATVEFKQELLNTALALGTVVKEGDKYRTVTKNAKGEVSDLFDATHNFNDALNNQWMTTDVLTQTLKKYADETTELGKKAYASAQDVKTFSMMMDTLKEAAQSGWAQTWEILVGDFEEAKTLFTRASEFLGTIIGNSAKHRNELLEGALSAGGSWSKFEEQLKSAGIASDDFQEKLKETARSHGIAIDKMIEEEGSFLGTLKKGWLNGNLISETLKKYIDGTKAVTGATKDMADKVAYFQKAVDDVWRGVYGNGEVRVKALTKAGYDYATVQDLVNKTVDGHRLTIEDLSDAQMENLGYTKEQIEQIRELAKEAERTGSDLNDLIAAMEKPSGRELLIETLANAGNTLVQVFGAVKKAWSETFEPIESSDIYNVIAKVNEVSRDILTFTTKNSDKLVRIFKGLFAILDIITTLTTGGLKIAFKVLCKLFNVAGDDALEMAASLGDIIVNFRDWLLEGNAVAKFLEKFIDIIADGVKILHGWINEILAMPEVQAAIATVQNGINNVISKVGKYFSEGGERIGKFIEYVKSLDSITLSDLDDIFFNFKENVIDYFFDFEGMLERIKTGIGKFKETFEHKFSGVVDFFKGVGEDIRTTTENIKNWISDNLGGIIFVTVSGGIIAALLAVKKVLGAFSSPIEALTDLIANFSKGIKQIMSAKAFEIAAGGMVKIALALAILAGSLVVISMIPAEKLEATIKALGVLALGMVGLAASIALFNKLGGGASVASTSVVAIAGSMLILVYALKMMEDLDPDKLGKDLAVLGGMTLGLALLAGILGRCSAQLTGGAVWLVAIAGALWVLVGVFKRIEELNIRNVGKSMFLLLGAVVALGLVVTACKKIKLSSALGVIGVIASLYLFVGALERIADLNLSKITNNIEAFAAVFGAFALLMISSAFAGKNALKGGAGILLMSGALIVIVGAIKMMENIDPLSLERATDAITQLIAVFSLIMVASKFAGEHAGKAGVMFLGMAAAIAVIAGVIWMLTTIKDEAALKRAVGAIAALELVFGALIALTHFAKDFDQIKGTLITLTVVVGIMALAVAGLSMIPAEKLGPATAALSTLMGVFAILVASTKNAKKAAGTLIILTGVVAALAIVLYQLQDLDPIGSLGNAAALSLLMLTLSGVLKSISSIQTVSTQAIGGLAGLTIVMMGLALPLKFLAGIDPLGSIANATALSMLMVALAGALKMVSTIPVLSAGATKGLYAMTGVLAITAIILGLLAAAESEFGFSVSIEQAAALSLLLIALAGAAAMTRLMPNPAIVAKGAASIGAFAGIIAAIAGLMGWIASLFGEGGLENFETGMQMLERVGLGIGTFVGNLIGGLGSGLTSGLEKMGEDLSAFMDAAQPFFDGLDQIDNDKVVAVGLLAATIMALTAADFVQGIAGLFGAGINLEEFGNQIGELGKGLKKFSDEVQGIDSDAVTAASSAASVLGSLANNLPRYGGVFAEWFGEKMNLETFGNQLESLGAGIKKYNDALVGDGSGIDADAISASANAAMTLSELANSLPTYGGRITEWFGEKINLVQFGIQLQYFGQAIKMYSDTLLSGDKKFNAKLVEQSGNAALVLSELANSLPTYGGKITEWFGEQINLASFGNQLAMFGKALKMYSDTISADGGINIEAIEASANAAMTLSNLANSLPTYGGKMAEWFGGQVDLATFGVHLQNFGHALRAYSIIVSSDGGINSDAIQTSYLSAMILVNLANSLPEYEGKLSSWFGGQINLEEFGQQILGFATHLVAYSNTVSSVNPAVVQKTGEAAQSLATLANALPDNKLFTNETTIDEFGKQMKKFGGYFYEYYESVSGVEVGRLSGVIIQTTKLLDLVNTMAGVNIEGLQNFGKALETIGDIGVDKFVGAFENSHERVSSAVSGMIRDFTEGINNQKPNLITATANIPADMIREIQNAYEQFTEAGSRTIECYMIGANTRLIPLLQNVETIMAMIYNKVKVEYETFYYQGMELISRLDAGMTDKKYATTNTMGLIMDELIAVIELRYNAFRHAGNYVVSGFAQGLMENHQEVVDAAARLGSAAASATSNALDINSPSRVFYTIGDYAGAGFVKALLDSCTAVYDASSEMGTAAERGISTAMSKIIGIVNRDISVQPTIRPVVDMSNVTAGSKRINALFGTRRAVRVNSVMAENATALHSTVDSNIPAAGNNYTFNQYNSSPKAISSAEIYRQTKNQFATFRRKVEG